MKYILRIVVVIAMIAGIFFGINYCNSITSNEKKVVQMLEGTVSISLNLRQDYENDIKEIAPPKTEEPAEPEAEEVKFEIKEAAKALENLKTAYNTIIPFMAEIYFAKNVKGEDVAKFETLTNAVKENYEKYKTAMKGLKNLDQNNAAYESYMENYSKQIANHINNCSVKFVNLTVEVLNYIKVYVHNNSTVNTEIKEALENLQKLQNEGV